MAHIYLGVADEEHFESEVEKFGLKCKFAGDIAWGFEYKVEGPRDKIEKFLPESYCVGADDDGEFLADLKNEIE
jgi:hypothetical protein